MPKKTQKLKHSIPKKHFSRTFRATNCNYSRYLQSFLLARASCARIYPVILHFLLSHLSQPRLHTERHLLQKSSTSDEKTVKQEQNNILNLLSHWERNRFRDVILLKSTTTKSIILKNNNLQRFCDRCDSKIVKTLGYTRVRAHARVDVSENFTVEIRCFSFPPLGRV